MSLKRCVKCGHETSQQIASVACIDGAYHVWEPVEVKQKYPTWMTMGELEAERESVNVG